MIARKMIEWCDTKFNEALHEDDSRKASKKVVTSGAVEGFMDAALVMFVPVLIACYVWQDKATKK